MQELDVYPAVTAVETGLSSQSFNSGNLADDEFSSFCKINICCNTPKPPKDLKVDKSRLSLERKRNHVLKLTGHWRQSKTVKPSTISQTGIEPDLSEIYAARYSSHMLTSTEYCDERNKRAALKDEAALMFAALEFGKEATSDYIDREISRRVNSNDFSIDYNCNDDSCTLQFVRDDVPHDFELDGSINTSSRLDRSVDASGKTFLNTLFSTADSLLNSSPLDEKIPSSRATNETRKKEISKYKKKNFDYIFKSNGLISEHTFRIKIGDLSKKAFTICQGRVLPRPIKRSLHLVNTSNRPPNHSPFCNNETLFHSINDHDPITGMKIAMSCDYSCLPINRNNYQFDLSYRKFSSDGAYLRSSGIGMKPCKANYSDISSQRRIISEIIKGTPYSGMKQLLLFWFINRVRTVPLRLLIYFRVYVELLHTTQYNRKAVIRQLFISGR